MSSAAEPRAEGLRLKLRFLVGLATALKHVITPANRFLLRVSKGRVGNTFLGVPVLVLHTIGNKSRLPRATPLYYLSHQGKIILVASNGGNVRNPGWLVNIKTQSHVTVEIRGERTRMRAHIAGAEEYAFYWPLLTEVFPTWGRVQEASLRAFPMAVLEPIQSRAQTDPEAS